MKYLSRKTVFSAVAVCLALMLGATPALAKSSHKHRSKTHHSRTVRKAKASSSRAVVRSAQEHLYNLGYYLGGVDGLMGPQTKAAIKRFQREQDLKVDGVLGPQTISALEYADRRAPDNHVQMLMHEPAPRGVVSGAVVNQNYETSMAGGTKEIFSRFARLDISESGVGADKRYNVNMDGQSVLSAGGQPSIVSISPTYDLGMEDAIVFTTYSPDTSGCIYKTHVLVLGSFGNKMLDVENCTRNYQARVDNDSLYLTFPELDANRAVGSVWRIEGTSAERL